MLHDIYAVCGLIVFYHILSWNGVTKYFSPINLIYTMEKIQNLTYLTIKFSLKYLNKTIC